MLPSAQECPICPNADIHRVQGELYRFESTRRSNQELIWTSRIQHFAIRNTPQLGASEISELLRKLRQNVSDELDQQARTED